MPGRFGEEVLIPLSPLGKGRYFKIVNTAGKATMVAGTFLLFLKEVAEGRRIQKPNQI